MADLRPRGFQSIPPVIKNLLIINVLVWLAELTFGQRFIDLVSLHYPKAPDFGIWQIVTCMFAHAPGLGHIFWNMLALWMFGSALEEIWGSKRFLLFYMICGIGASLIQLGVLSIEMNYLWHKLANGMPQDEFVAKGGPIYWFSELGASGAINGVMVAFAYLFPNMPLLLFPLPVPVKIKYMVIVYFLVDLFAGINPQPGDTIAHIAHVGGAIVGLILVITMNRSNRRTFY